jgi:hypothetical protein
MEFRWLALVAVWTLLVGPVFGPPASKSKSSAAAVRPAPARIATTLSK